MTTENANVLGPSFIRYDQTKSAYLNEHIWITRPLQAGERNMQVALYWSRTWNYHPILL